MITRTLVFGVILHFFLLGTYTLPVSAEGDESAPLTSELNECQTNLSQTKEEIGRNLAPSNCHSQSSNDKTETPQPLPPLQVNHVCSLDSLSRDAKAGLTPNLDLYFKHFDLEKTLPVITSITSDNESNPVLQFTRHVWSIKHALQERIKSLPSDSKERKAILKSLDHLTDYSKNLISESNKLKESVLKDSEKLAPVAFNQKMDLRLSEKFKYGEELFIVISKNLSEKDEKNQTIYLMIKEFETFLGLSAGQSIASLIDRLRVAEKLEASREAKTETKNVNEVLRKTLKRAFVKSRQQTCYDNEIAYATSQLEKAKSDILSTPKSSAKQLRDLHNTKKYLFSHIVNLETKRKYVNQILLRLK